MEKEKETRDARAKKRRVLENVRAEWSEWLSNSKGAGEGGHRRRGRVCWGAGGVWIPALQASRRLATSMFCLVGPTSKEKPAKWKVRLPARFGERRWRRLGRGRVIKCSKSARRPTLGGAASCLNECQFWLQILEAPLPWVPGRETGPGRCTAYE